MAGHGTYAHYISAKCRCDACRAASAAYQREHRARNPGRVAVDRRQNAAYRAAAVALRERHRAEFEALYEAEKRTRGVS